MRDALGHEQSDSVEQFPILGEFRDMAVRSDNRRELGKFVVGPICRDDDASLPKPIHITDHFDEQASIEPWHIDVDDHDVGSGFTNGMEATEGTMMKTRGKPTLHEAPKRTASKCVVVVNDEHSAHVPPANGSMRVKTRCVVSMSESVSARHSGAAVCKRWTNAGTWENEQKMAVRRVVRGAGIAKAERVWGRRFNFAIPRSGKWKPRNSVLVFLRHTSENSRGQPSSFNLSKPLRADLTPPAPLSNFAATPLVERGEPRKSFSLPPLHPAKRSWRGGSGG